MINYNICIYQAQATIAKFDKVGAFVIYFINKVGRRY
jgi:hypothetical protein